MNKYINVSIGYQKNDQLINTTAICSDEDDVINKLGELIISHQIDETIFENIMIHLGGNYEDDLNIEIYINNSGKLNNENKIKIVMLFKSIQGYLNELMKKD